MTTPLLNSCMIVVCIFNALLWAVIAVTSNGDMFAYCESGLFITLTLAFILITRNAKGWKKI